MAEIYVNNSEYAFLKIFQAGVPTPADTTPVATVTDGAGNSLGSHPVVPDGTGVYKTLLTLADTALEGIIKVRWDFVIFGQGSAKIDQYNVVSPLLTLSEVATRAPAGTSDDDLALAEQYARYMIQSVTNQDFGQRADTVEAYGQNADVLLLPKRVISVDKLWQNGELMIDTTVPTNTFNFPIEITDTNHAIRIVFDGYPIQQWTEGGVFNVPGKFKTSFRYKVHGVFGWESIPGEIKLAALMLVNDFFCKDSAWRNKYIEDMSSADWSITFNEAVWAGTGNFTVDSILGDYIWNSMVVI